MENENQSFEWGLFILGILSIILALIAFYNPASGVLAIVFLFAFGAIIKGIFELTYRRRTSRFREASKTAITIIGVIDILIGVILLFNQWIGLLAVPFIFAIWFITDSIGALFLTNVLRGVNNALFWFSLVLGIIGLILGVFLLFNPVSGFITVAYLIGFFFMLNGIVAIVQAF